MAGLSLAPRRLSSVAARSSAVVPYPCAANFSTSSMGEPSCRKIQERACARLRGKQSSQVEALPSSGPALPAGSTCMLIYSFTAHTISLQHLPAHSGCRHEGRACRIHTPTGSCRRIHVNTLNFADPTASGCMGASSSTACTCLLNSCSADMEVEHQVATTEHRSHSQHGFWQQA